MGGSTEVGKYEMLCVNAGMKTEKWGNGKKRSHLATGSGDNTIRLWDINTQTPIATLKDHTHWVLAVNTQTPIATLKDHTHW
ncbi:ribosome assembly protein 4, putative, partial [Plasmodium ovale curtisi]